MNGKPSCAANGCRVRWPKSGRAMIRIAGPVRGDGLRASITRYPHGKQGPGYRLRRNVQQGNGSGQRVNCSTAVRQYLKPSDVGSRPSMSMCSSWNQYV